MEAIALTTEQQTEAATLKTAADKAVAAAQTARAALQAFLDGVAGTAPVKGKPGVYRRLSLTDDGKTIVVA